MISNQIFKSKQTIFSLLFLAILFSACNKNTHKIQINKDVEAEATLIYENSFEDGLDDWQVEQMPNGTTEIIDGKLEIDDVGGCTIWLKKEFEGPIMIEYDALVIQNGGINDRVSDLNCFWMAKDLESPTDLFKNSEKRGGKFPNYDSLRLYYMGVGGHNNSKTRFRRYVGNGERPLLPEYDFSNTEYLITPNQLNKIKIIAFDGVIQYYRNKVLMVDFQDSEPYTSGYFGFRTVNNHMTVDNFRVYKLSKK